jgi:hypothetical protein
VFSTRSRGSFGIGMPLFQSLPTRLVFCRGRIPQLRRLAGALAIKRGADLCLQTGPERSHYQFTQMVRVLCTRISGLRGQLVARHSTDRDATQYTKRRDHNDLFDFVAISTPSTALERHR